MKLENKTIVITGAGRGLGEAMAVAMAGQGANIALVDLDEGALQHTAERCREHEGAVRTYRSDVSQEAAVEQMFEQVMDDFGSVDGLINNAGVTRDGLLVKARDGEIQGKMSIEDWDTVIRVNLRGVFLCGREAAVRMIRGHYGQPPAQNGACRGVILNISSISRGGNFGQTNYAAAKAGVAAMTVTWADELARHGIRVAAISPGFCDTRMVQQMNDKARDKFVSRIPLNRFGNADEIGDAALFVFRNDYFNGKILDIDGGLRL